MRSKSNSLCVSMAAAVLVWAAAAHAVPSAALLTAMERGDRDGANYLISQGIDLRVRTESGATALHVAAALGYPLIAQMLLDTGANPEELGPNGNTPLLFAAQEGHAEVVGVLLQAGADPLTTNDFGATAVGLALGLGHRDVVSEFGRTILTADASPPNWLWATGLLAAAGISVTVFRRHRERTCRRPCPAG